MCIQRYPFLRRVGLAALSAPIAVLPVLLGATAIVHMTRQLVAGPVYSVAVLRTHLAQDPEAWTNRPLRVRAIATTMCSAWLGSAHQSPCVDQQPVLSDPAASVEPLPLAWGGVSPPVALLRRLPLLSAMMPAPQPVRWDSLATYSIRLHAFACGSSGQPRCYEALLMDAGSFSQLGVRER
jgi:hypothetical protein